MNYKKQNSGFTPTPTLASRCLDIVKSIYTSFLSSIFRKESDMRQRKTMPKLVSGFTLIELLVVISIISMLASIVLSNVNNARERARIAAGQQLEANIVHGIGDQLIGQWTFDEGSGTAIDTSSFGNNGSVNGAIWEATGGFNGKGAYRFSYGGSHISLGNSNILNIGNGTSFTISAWINYDDDSPYNTTIFYEGDSSGGYGSGDGSGGPGIQFNVSANKLALSFYTGGTTGDVTIPKNRWTHVAATYVAPTKTVTYYINGALDKSVVSSYGPGFVGFGCAQIGARYCWGYFTRDFTGWVDNVRVYSTSITASDIKHIYAKERGKFDNLAIN